jgi:radical SAM superfamily enzyme YgiQ (UPF0313 family)
MTTPTLYLTPGFFITLSSKRQVIHLMLLTGAFRKATPARLEVIDALSKGYPGDVESLIQHAAERVNGKPSAIREFVEHLAANGYLTDCAPPVRDVAQPSGAVGTIGAGEVNIATPVGLVTDAGNYLWYNHEGDLQLRLSIAEVVAAAMFCEPITVSAAREQYLALAHRDGLSGEQFDAFVSRMAGTGLLIPARRVTEVVETPLVNTVDQNTVQSLVDAKVAAHDAEVAKSRQALVPVVPVNTQKGTTPLALGLLVAYAMDYDGGRLCSTYNFVPMFLTDEARLVKRGATPGVYLFSNYVWNVEINLQLSAAIKAISPGSVTIHGGPSTPSYEQDCEKFFRENPHVDITVRGEGELTFAELLDALDPANLCNLEVLRDVAGLTYRTADGVHRTGNRERIADLNTIPSPYLLGLFDEFGSVGAGAVIETNRGCPYGCTFCDWGSATLSKVRKFDLDRVYKELEWSARHQIEDASIGDANFGMLERDVEITEKIAELKRTYGFPRSVAINYAKNQVAYLRQIIEIMASVEILAEGVVSLQTTDEQALKVINRSNIKLDKYNELSSEFRKARLPLAADIMMGLPGSTPTSFKTDLQRCTDRDIRVRANPTQLLPNSPMNEPEYRKKHGIVAAPGEWLKETATYTREQWEEMDRLRMAYYLFDSYGILRYVARFVRSETGMGEVDFYDRVQAEVLRRPDAWPVISTSLKSLERYMAPPGSWALFIDEVHRFLVDHLGMPDDSALRTTLAVQHAHLPSPGRRFPYVVELEHDYIAWQEALFTSREEGHRDDWQDHIPRLSEFGPTSFTIRDPNSVCDRDIGHHKNVLDVNVRSWDLDSPLARPRLGIAAK